MSSERQIANSPSLAKRRSSNETPPRLGLRKLLTRTVVSSTTLGMLSLFSAVFLDHPGDRLLLRCRALFRIRLQVFHPRGCINDAFPRSLSLDHLDRLQKHAVL